MKVSFFETVRYLPPRTLPAEWPVPSGAYDREAGAQAYRTMLERLEYVEELGFDWVSVSEHHYSPRILTPSPIVSAAFIAAHLRRMTIALLGPIVPHSNPVRVAEELAMLDTMAQGRLVVGLLRGTTNEALTYDLNPAEARERTDEGMELILKAWTEPEPFGWQGRHFHYRTVSIWPRPLQQPHPPTYALGTSRESLEFAARHHLGCGVSYGPFDAMGKATRYYREQCARHGWQPAPDQILYRANMLLAETDDEAHDSLRARPGQAPFTMREGVRDAMMTLDSRNVAGEARAPVVSGALPTTFIGSPDTVVEQVRRCRDVVGAGVLDLSLHPRAPPTWSRSCARWSCSGNRCSRASARSEESDLTAAFRERFVEADGFRIRYVEAGEGPPLVHLHGAGGLRLTPAHDLLSRHFRVVALEMPGFGHSAENTRTQSMAELAGTVTRALDSLGLAAFNLMGTSFGAKTALWLALQSPARVLALVLEAPAAIRQDGAQSPTGSPDEIAGRLYAHPERLGAIPLPDPAVQAKTRALVQRLRGPDRDAELESRLPGLATPTLVLFGTLDRVIAPAMGRVYKTLMRDCHLVFVYDAGHAISTDRPAAFTEVVEDFLERHDAFVISRAETVIHP